MERGETWLWFLLGSLTGATMPWVFPSSVLGGCGGSAGEAGGIVLEPCCSPCFGCWFWEDPPLHAAGDGHSRDTGATCPSTGEVTELTAATVPITVAVVAPWQWIICSARALSFVP